MAKKTLREIIEIRTFHYRGVEGRLAVVRTADGKIHLNIDGTVHELYGEVVDWQILDVVPAEFDFHAAALALRRKVEFAAVDSPEYDPPRQEETMNPPDIQTVINDAISALRTAQDTAVSASQSAFRAQRSAENAGKAAVAAAEMVDAALANLQELVARLDVEKE